MEKNLWNKSFSLLCSVNFLVAFTFYAIMALLPGYLNSHVKIDSSQIGILMSSFTLSALLIRPFAGYLIDNHRKKLILGAAILLFATSFLLYLFSATFVSIFVVRFIQGIAWGAFSSTASVMVIDVLPVERRGEGIGLYGVFMTGAMAISPLVSIFALKFTSYGNLFIVSFFIVFGCLGLILKVKSFNTFSNKKFTFHEVINVKVIPLSLFIMIATMAYGSVLSFITLYAADRHYNNVGFFFLAQAIGLTLMRFLAGKAYDRNGPKVLTILSFASLITGFLLMIFSGNEFLFCFSAIFIGMGYGSLFPASQAMINELVTAKDRGTANATFLTFFDTGVGLGMISTGFLSKLFGFQTAYLMCVAYLLIALTVFLIIGLKYYLKHRITNAL
ncbi:MAG TPA: MFS transporter [Bacteroidales bacterium]|nr:MFS transporter [Bacteroidales bacterium]